MKRKLTREYVKELQRLMREPISRLKKADEEIIEQELSQTLVHRSELLSKIDIYISPHILDSESIEDKISNYGALGNKLLNQGKIQEAEIAYKISIDYGRNNNFFIDNYYPTPYLGLGLIFEDNKPEKAIAFFSKAINMANNFNISSSENIYHEEEISVRNELLATSYLYKAYLLEKLKKLDEAAINFGEAAIYNKYLYSAYFGKATCLGELGRFEEAITSYDKLLAINLSHSQSEHCIYAYYNKASLLNIIQKYEEEVNALDKFINYKNEYEKNTKQLISIGFGESYLAKAEALSKLNKNQEAYYCKGLAEYFKQKYKKAIDFFNQSLDKSKEKANPDTMASCYFYKGCSLIKLNKQTKENESEMVECFNKAYENVSYFRIKALLHGFIVFNSRILEVGLNNDLIFERDNLIEEFISKIMFDVTSSKSTIISNINTLIFKTAELVNKQNLSTFLIVNTHNIAEQDNVKVSGEIVKDIDESDSL